MHLKIKLRKKKSVDQEFFLKIVFLLFLYQKFNQFILKEDIGKQFYILNLELVYWLANKFPKDAKKNKSIFMKSFEKLKDSKKVEFPRPSEFIFV